MASAVTAIPIAVSVGIPLAFLYAVRRLDLYATGSFRLILVCFAGGLIAFPLALAVNTSVRDALMVAGGLAVVQALLLVRTFVAPMTEEVLKSLGVVAGVRRSDFTYFVDGAVCGFAAGTAFAVFENGFYLRQPGVSGGLALGINRAFSTSLMHGSASALVGVSLGRARFARGWGRLAALVIGWSAAVILHAGFNRVVTVGELTQAKLAAAFALGLGGVALTAGFIFWGLHEEQVWLRQSLGLDVGVSQGEAAVVQRLADLKLLLQPVEDHFGRRRRDQVESLLRLQARLGLKRRVHDLTSDPHLRGQLDLEIASMREKADALRREVGVYCMVFVRSILPPEVETLWDRLSQALAEVGPPTMDLYGLLTDRTADEAGRGAGAAGPVRECGGGDLTP